MWLIVLVVVIGCWFLETEDVYCVSCDQWTSSLSTTERWRLFLLPRAATATSKTSISPGKINQHER